MAGSYAEYDNLTSQILKYAFEVHTALGPGLLESAYKECLSYKLAKSGLYIEKEKAIPIVFEEVRLECGYRLDILVEKQIVIELKSVEALNDVHLGQVLTYLKLGNYKIGYLMNYNVTSLKNGIRRIVN